MIRRPPRSTLFPYTDALPIWLDGPIKVTGRAIYAYDINLPGLLHGRILRCPLPHATIESIDASAAEKMPGVKAVILTAGENAEIDRKSTRLNSSHSHISYAVF